MTQSAINIAGLRCFNHGNREAVARCLECSRYYCRECVTEHGTRVLCSNCLGGAGITQKPRQRVIGVAWRAAQFFVAFCVAWFVLYAMGRGLLWIPSEFHEQMIWDTEWFSE